MLNLQNIFDTIDMIDKQHLDIRTITMGISLLDCVSEDPKRCCDKIYDKICRRAEKLVQTGRDIESEFGIPIVNKRISVTPMALVAGSCDTEDYVPFALTLDRAGKTCGVDFLGGYSALVQKGFSKGDELLLRSIPQALAQTDLVCSSVNVGSTKAGINMDAVARMGRIIKETAHLTRDKDGLGCAKLVVFCNAVEDNPFMAGAFHGVGEADSVINVGVSGPGVVYHALQKCKGEPFDVVAETIKKTAFQITRMGQMVATEASRRLDTPFGIVDLSLAPTPAIGDSVARILEEMGLAVCGTHGTTAALALLNDAVKKGGIMASGHVGGLSGAFIPVSEDEGMIAAARYARENNVPYLGICLGMQIAVIEFARHVLGWADAHSTEMAPQTAHPVIDLMPDQVGVATKGGTMRLGQYPCVLSADSRARALYGQSEISERHRHRYEFNNDYRDILTQNGLTLSGLSPDGRLVETVELSDRPFYVGVQYHPEFKSRPNKAHPLFKGFIAAALEKSEIGE